MWVLVAVDFLQNGKRLAIERLSLIIIALQHTKEGQHSQSNIGILSKFDIVETLRQIDPTIIGAN